MSSLVEVEYHSADGNVTTCRMRMRDWKAFKCERRLEPGEFFLVFGNLQKRWDGCRRMRLKISRTAPGYVVRFRVRKDGAILPVVIPDEEAGLDTELL